MLRSRQACSTVPSLPVIVPALCVSSAEAPRSADAEPATAMKRRDGIPRAVDGDRQTWRAKKTKAARLALHRNETPRRTNEFVLCRNRQDLTRARLGGASEQTVHRRAGGLERRNGASGTQAVKQE